METLSAYKEAQFKGYPELDKFVEVTLGIGEKDFKKMVIFGLMLPHLKSLNDILITSLIELANGSSNQKVETRPNMDLDSDILNQEYSSPNLEPLAHPSRITENASELEKSSSKRQSSMLKQQDISTRKKHSMGPEKDYEEDFETANAVAVGENITEQ